MLLGGMAMIVGRGYLQPVKKRLLWRAGKKSEFRVPNREFRVQMWHPQL